MAVVLEGGCRVSEMREGEPLTNGTLRIWNRIGRATGAQAISLRVMEFAPGLSPAIRNDDCDQILYVLERGHPGRLSERSERNEVCTAPLSGRIGLLIDGDSYQLDPDTGIYVRPGETFAIDNPGPASIPIISSQCPDPDPDPQFAPATSSSPPSPLL